MYLDGDIVSKALRIKKKYIYMEKIKREVTFPKNIRIHVDPATVNSAAFRIFKLTSCRRKRRDFRLMESAIF